MIACQEFLIPQIFTINPMTPFACYLLPRAGPTLSAQLHKGAQQSSVILKCHADSIAFCSHSWNTSQQGEEGCREGNILDVTTQHQGNFENPTSRQQYVFD